MDFSISPEEQELQKRVRQLAQEQIAPVALKKGNRIERLYRDVRALTMVEGTSEIQRQTVARQLLREQG